MGCPHKQQFKNTTGEKEGKEDLFVDVTSSTQIPSKWKDFLRVDDNKTEIFKFLAEEVTRLPIEEGIIIYSTYGNDVLSTMACVNTTNIAPCSH